MELADAKQALQDNLDARQGLVDDCDASTQAKQKCFDNINALTALIAQMENPTPIAEPDYSVPTKDVFIAQIQAAKEAQKEVTPNPVEPIKEG